MRILIIDDEPTVIDVMHKLLRRDGHECLYSTNANDGLSLFINNAIDVVLTDIYMPDKNGLTLLDELRGFDPACYVIVFTGYGDIDTANIAMRKGAYAFFTKPIDFNNLRKTLNLIEQDIQMARQRTEITNLSS